MWNKLKKMIRWITYNKRIAYLEMEIMFDVKYSYQNCDQSNENHAAFILYSVGALETEHKWNIPLVTAAFSKDIGAHCGIGPQSREM